jgi:enamine deaminase RidA (YjgF/YER057c/UK114 family)
MVMNGCSEFLLQAFGEEVGPHARSAVGVNVLPLGVAVEIEAIIEVEP